SVPPTFPVGRLEKEECHPHSPWERFSPGYRRSSLMRAALPERSLRSYSLARRTLPRRTTSILSTRGEWSGNVLSTPTPWETFLTVNISLRPPPLFLITTPSNT